MAPQHPQSLGTPPASHTPIPGLFKCPHIPVPGDTPCTSTPVLRDIPDAPQTPIPVELGTIVSLHPWDHWGALVPQALNP